MPLFFYRPGYTSLGAAGVAGWFFSLVTGAVLLTWLYNESRGSLLVAGPRSLSRRGTMVAQ